MPTYAQLNQRHPSCDPERANDLCALYEGGTRFKERLERFLPQRPAEPVLRWQLRRQEASYRNYLGPIIDYFAALLFTSRPVAVAKDETGEPVLTPGDFYAGFRDDCDGNGTDLDSFFKERLTRAMVDGRSWFMLKQLPHGDADLAKLSKADFEKQRLGDTWLSAIESSSVLDWEETDQGALDWAIVHRKTARRAGPSAGRDTITESWDFLTAESIQTYEITYDRAKGPQATDEIPARGAPVPHRFGRVPLVVLGLPVSLWVANRLETPQLTHFRLSNAQTWGMASTCYAMPVYKVQSGDDGKPRMPTMGAGYGFVIGVDESIDWTAPPATVYAALGDEIKSQKDEIYRIAHQMALGVENNAAAVGRSADSKASDAEATRVVMLAFSNVVKETIEYVYDMLSASRGDTLDWSVNGLDGFASVDMRGLVESLGQLQQAGGIPSRTFQVQMKTRLAEGYLPDIDEETKAKIRDEIENNVTDQIPDMHLVELAKAHAIANSLADANNGGARGGSGAQPKDSSAGRSGGGNAAANAS